MILLAGATLGASLPHAWSAPRKSAKVVGIGAEDAKETGKLPPLTNELAQRGAAAVSRRDWKSAREIYREMVQAEPANALALANLGSVEYHLQDFDPAVEHLEAALRQRPNLAQTWLTLGMVHYQRDEHHLALSAISRAVAEKPNDPRAHNYLAAVIKALGWTTAAESELQKALDLDPNYSEAHFNLAIMYLDQKPPATEMARRHYLRALELGTPKDEVVEKQLNDPGGEELFNQSEASAPAQDAPSAPAPPKEAKKPSSSAPSKPKAKPKSKPKR
ncbi:MAG: tetratricopeptide repeat protein [Verrucomicrobiales bacterium]